MARRRPPGESSSRRPAATSWPAFGWRCGATTRTFRFRRPCGKAWRRPAIVHDPEPARVADLERRLARTIDVDGTTRPYLDQMTWNIVVGMAGLPATVAPVGLTADGLPVGAQIVAPPFGDRTTIAVAAA